MTKLTFLWIVHMSLSSLRWNVQRRKPYSRCRIYAPRYRSEWLSKITEAGVRRRAELYYQQLDALRLVRQQARKELLVEAKKHRATKLLLCPLGQSKKAIGHESQIGPCVATHKVDNCQA